MTVTEKGGGARSETGGARRGVHHGDLENALVTAASAMIAARASTDVSLREVAEAVGVSHTAAYRHFAAKSDLFAAIAERAFARLDDEIARAAARAGGGAAAGLVAAGRAYLAFAERNPGAYRVMFMPELCDRDRHPGLGAAMSAAFETLRRLVEAGQAAGEIVAVPSAEIVASTLWAAQHGHAALLIDGLVREGGGRGPGAPRADRGVLVELLVGAVTIRR